MPAFPGRSFNPARSAELGADPKVKGKKPKKKGFVPFAKGKKKGKTKAKGKMPFPPEAMKMAGAMRAAPFVKK